MPCGQCTYIDHLLSSHGQLLLTPEQKEPSPELAHPPLTQIYYSSLDHLVMHRDCPMIRANSPGGEQIPYAVTRRGRPIKQAQLRVADPAAHPSP